MKSIWGVAAVCALALLPAHAEAPTDDLIGIWAYETVFGSPLNDDLVVRRSGAALRATLRGKDVAVETKGGALRAVFPDDLGSFRGAIASDQGVIEGFWLRPGATADPRFPAGSSQPFATPIALRRDGATWRGTVRTLPNPFRLYLRIFRNDKNELTGAFRDPDQNRVGGAMNHRATRQGDDIHFTVRYENEPEIRHSATVLRGPDRLRLNWPTIGRAIELTRATPEQMARALPRAGGAATYDYRKPTATGDGWTTARAADTGIDEAVLTAIVKKLGTADPFLSSPSLIHSLLVAHRGKLVLEEYFFGYDRDAVHDTRSAGKTFSSVMLGAAMLQGAEISSETKVYELLAQKGPFANPDPRKAKITLSHLMTHTSGLTCNDYDDNSPGNEDTMQTQSKERDWWKYTLDLPMAHEPGARYAYCSANTNLMGAALTTGTRTWLPELFERSIARPLQFGPYHWNLMPTEEGYLGGGAYLRPRDLLKVGQAYLNGGVWNGHRIVDAAWVKHSTAARLRITPATTGLAPDDFPNYYGESDEGLAWHVNGVRSAKGRHVAYAASGNGGQVLLVVPEFDLAVVFTGGNYRQGGIWGRWGDEIVGGQIIPAIRR